MSNIESQPTHHLNENSAWNWSLKRCACVYFLIFILVLNASTYIWVYQKDVACFLHLKQLLLFIFVQESKCKSPHPLISSFTCCILQRIQTQKQKHTHTLKKVSEVRHRLRKHYYCDHRSPLFAPSRSRVTLMFRVSMHDIIRWFLLLLFKGRLYLENGCLGLDWDARYNLVWLGLIKVEGRMVQCISWIVRDHRKPIYRRMKLWSCASYLFY